MNDLHSNIDSPQFSNLTIMIAVQQNCKYLLSFVWQASFSTHQLLSSLFCSSASSQKALEILAFEHKAEAEQSYSQSSPPFFIGS